MIFKIFKSFFQDASPLCLLDLLWNLLLTCWWHCCVVVSVPPLVCKDLVTFLLLNSRKQVLLPRRFPTVFMGFVVAFVVDLLLTLLRCCWRSPTGMRGFGDILVIKLKKTSTSSGTLPHCVYWICCEICCWLVVDTLEAPPLCLLELMWILLLN